MNITAPPGTFEAVAEVCVYHLGKGVVEQNESTLLPDSFLDVEQAHVTDKMAQHKALVEIEQALKLALRRFYSLHPDVSRSVEWLIGGNLENDSPAVRLQAFCNVDGHGTPFHSNDNFELYLRAALSSFLGVPADTSRLEFQNADPTKSAHAAAKNVLSELVMKPLTKQARTGETWQKAIAVKRCRELWESAKGTDAPRSYSGPFGEFLADMVEALGKIDEWKDARSVMNAWRRCSEQNQWFL